ncbi:MAG TPA: Fic/DOC family N-terminal domain-containing protein [Mucilaginibacter sp.]|jgi:Fic family protein|nr:Fic/DOC family N-terminal domain-containing protein [Mucilaginibacter sp.]
MAYDRNRPYNNLPALPPPPEIENDVEILKKLVSASRALAAVNSSVLRLPNPFMLVNTIALQEAKTSTEIENIFTSDDELYKAISDTIQEKSANVATKEVLRYREALWEGYRLIKEKNTIDQDCIISIFRQIKNTSAALRSPQSQTTIKRGQREFRAGEIIYTPPRGPGLIEMYMENLLDYLNDDEKYSTDPLLKMCISHYQFEAIHPFQDGNGRTGRILNLLYLANKGLLTQPTLYLSKYIIIHKEDYYYTLGAVTQRGSWKEWILYMLDAVENTSLLTNSLINGILDQMNATLEHGKAKLKWYNKEINEIIFSQPYLKPKMLIQRSSRTTLARYMNDLTNAKILTTQKDGKEVYYLNQDLIRILEG